jgi:hypothetical protein
VGTYAESLLADGEEIIRRERQHWLSLFLDARSALGLWVLAILLLVAIVVFNIQSTSKDFISWVAAAALILGLLIFLWNWWHWRTEEYLVTNRRLLKVSGIFNKTSGDSSLEKINDAILFENLLGRMLDYGDLDILTAADVAVDRYRMLNHAKAFKIDMLNAKHTLEHEVSYVNMPSPPIRAMSGTGPPVAPIPPAAPAPPAGPFAAPVAAPVADATAVAATDATTAMASTAPAATALAQDIADTPDEVAAALARLADLRDRGAITADEYDRKKAELLGRL